MDVQYPRPGIGQTNHPVDILSWQYPARLSAHPLRRFVLGHGRILTLLGAGIAFAGPRHENPRRLNRHVEPAVGHLESNGSRRVPNSPFVNLQILTNLIIPEGRTVTAMLRIPADPRRMP